MGEVVNPKISVIMLTYNRERLVGRMIECILAQTFIDFEFIIVDNGSSDRSGVIAEEYAAKDARIRVIHREKGNIGSGRNAGLDAARGDWIAFIDDDDMCTPDFLEFMYQLAIENEAEISICGAADKVYEEKLVLSPQDALVTLFWRRRFNVQFPTKLIHQSLFEHVRFDAKAKYDDIELMPRMIGGAKKIAYHGLPKYTFERHENNNSAWTTNHSLISPEILTEYLKVYRERTDWLCKAFPEKKRTWQYFEWSFMISMVEKVSRLELVECYEIKDALVKALSTHREEFLGCEEILEFEKEWVERYLKTHK